MKYFSFRTLIICLLFPPLLYFFSMQALEKQLARKYAAELDGIYIGNAQILLNGGIRLREAINRNIDNWLKRKNLSSLGIQVDVTVKTKKGTLLYPALFDEERNLFQPENPMEIGAKNYELLNEEPVLSLRLEIKRISLVSIGIFAAYIALATLILFVYYRAGVKKAQNEERKREEKIRELTETEKEHLERMKSLDMERELLNSEINRVKHELETEKTRASENEDDLVNEIVSLEEKIAKNLEQQKERQKEFELLKEEIQRLEKGKRKKKEPEILQKRFKALYKNLSVTERAIDGFINLPDELKIKCEEVIHQLNDDPSVVTIKRKVFGKKGRETVLEVLFAYKGRLYFRNTQDTGVEVLAIGTKNTQAKELEFLNKL